MLKLNKTDWRSWTEGPSTTSNIISCFYVRVHLFWGVVKNIRK